MRKDFGLVPFGGISMRNWFDDDFGSLIPRGLQDFAAFNKVRSDIKETDTEYVVEAELPGFNKEDIKLEIDDGVLSITAETKSEKEENKDNYVRKERFSGSFVRHYAFENVDESAISAKYNNGVLEVTLPKKEKVETKKGISIE